MIFKRWRRAYVIDLEDRYDRSQRNLELETSRRQGLQQDLLAVVEERDGARGCAARAEEEQAKALDRVGDLLETRDRLTAERDAARDEAASMGQGILAIHGERLTHISEHNYGLDHDDEREEEELALAAACYAAPVHIYELTPHGEEQFVFTELWPFEAEEDHRHRRSPDAEGLVPRDDEMRQERIHELAKAGSLIAAEIERIVRLGGSERTPPGRADLPGGGPGRAAEEIGLCGIAGPGGHDCFRVKGHEGPHSWEGGVHRDLGPGPGRDH